MVVVPVVLLVLVWLRRLWSLLLMLQWWLLLWLRRLWVLLVWLLLLLLLLLLRLRLGSSVADGGHTLHLLDNLGHDPAQVVLALPRHQVRVPNNCYAVGADPRMAARRRQPHDRRARGEVRRQQ